MRPNSPVMNGTTTGSRRSRLRHQNTAHDWVSEKEQNVVDDGTMTFFWRAHTLTVLFILTCCLIYVAVMEVPSQNSEYNMKRGIIAVVLVFLLFGVTQTPDGPFKRPHPALWRFIFCVSVVYELGLIYILFQTADDARRILTYFDSNLGQPLPEKDYGGNCLLYDPDFPSDPFHNIWDKMDGFVITHFVGFWIKTLMLRDYWLCTVFSIMFEFLEYSLEHQLPNFSECWWDHWIMDALVCNGLGIYCGMLTLRFLDMKEYNWRGMWTFRSFRGKVKRVALQFTPYTWMKFDWRPFESFTRWIAMLGLIFVFLLAELNTFYLKFVLWLPPPHYLNLVRLFFFMLAGAVAMRETFQYLDDPECKKFGRQSWMVLAIVITELLIVAKFGWDTITLPLPAHVIIFWSVAFIVLTSWTVWNFFLKPYIWHHEDHDTSYDTDTSFSESNVRKERTNSSHQDGFIQSKKTE